MKNILITGSAGFIGFSVSKYFLEKNINVLGIDNLNNYYDKNLKLERLKILKTYANYEFLNGDISKKKTFNESFFKRVLSCFRTFSLYFFAPSALSCISLIKSLNASLIWINFGIFLKL